MTDTFNEDGLFLNSFLENIEMLKEKFLTVFESDFNTDDKEDIGGQLIIILAEMKENQAELIQAIDAAYNPVNGKGKALTDLCRISGVKRKDDVYSTVACDCEAGVEDCNLYAGDEVTDQKDQNIWKLDNDYTIPANTTATLSFTCSKPGPVKALQNTITKIKTTRLSWLSVNNPAASTVGRTEEADGPLKIRRDNKVFLSVSDCSGPAIESKLNDLTGVSSVSTFYNKTDEIDSDGVPAGGMWAIVYGGNDADIARILATNCAPTTQYKGAVSYSYEDERGKLWPTKWDRPDDIDNYISMTIEVNDTFPSNGLDQIRKAITDYYDGYVKIGKKVKYSKVYSSIDSIKGFSVKNFFLSFSANPTSGTSNLEPAEKYQRCSIVSDNIKITVLIDED